MNKERLANASGVSNSTPPVQRPSALGQGNGAIGTADVPEIRVPNPAATAVSRKAVPQNSTSGGLVPPSTRAEESRDSYIDGDVADMRRSNNYLGSFINARDSTLNVDSAAPANTAPPEPEIHESVVAPVPKLYEPPVRKSSLDTPSADPAAPRHQSLEAQIIHSARSSSLTENEINYG